MNTTERTFEEVGTLATFVDPKKGEIFDDPINLRDVTKQIYFKFAVKGVMKTAICSWPITNLLRTKQIAYGNLFDYPMSISNDGLYSIHSEERTLRSHKVASFTKKKLVVVDVTDEETVVL